MPPKPKTNYKKYIYWLTRKEEHRLREKLLSRQIRLRSAKGVACGPLDEISRIASVAPEIWNETCARQGSWYRASDKCGLYLVISACEVSELKNHSMTVITPSDFRPRRWASEGEKKSLVDDPAFNARIPQQWRKVGDAEKRIYLRWAQRLGSNAGTFDALFLAHTANHANFIRPRFFIEEKGHPIPYSIDRSAHLCSSCLEFFQILGEVHPKKLVAPCPGATIFARLRPDQYLLVEHRPCQNAPAS